MMMLLLLLLLLLWSDRIYKKGAELTCDQAVTKQYDEYPATHARGIN